jgi:hypothetical protein
MDHLVTDLSSAVRQLKGKCDRVYRTAQYVPYHVWMQHQRQASSQLSCIRTAKHAHVRQTKAIVFVCKLIAVTADAQPRRDVITRRAVDMSGL